MALSKAMKGYKQILKNAIQHFKRGYFKGATSQLVHVLASRAMVVATSITDNVLRRENIYY